MGVTQAVVDRLPKRNAVNGFGFRADEERKSKRMGMQLSIKFFEMLLLEFTGCVFEAGFGLLIFLFNKEGIVEGLIWTDGPTLITRLPELVIFLLGRLGNRDDFGKQGPFGFSILWPGFSRNGKKVFVLIVSLMGPGGRDGTWTLFAGHGLPVVQRKFGSSHGFLARHLSLNMLTGSSIASFRLPRGGGYNIGWRHGLISG